MNIIIMIYYNVSFVMLFCIYYIYKVIVHSLYSLCFSWMAKKENCSEMNNTVAIDYLCDHE